MSIVHRYKGRCGISIVILAGFDDGIRDVDHRRSERCDIGLLQPRPLWRYSPAPLAISSDGARA